MSAAPPSGLVQPDAWFIACASRALRAAPRALTVQSRRLVLFRAKGGVAIALSDRCPHRNVPLSLGRVTGGELDVLGPQVTRLLKQSAAGAPPGPPHEHRLKMAT